MELSKTEMKQDLCGADLEDTLTDSETDKAVGLANLLKGIERIKLAMNPCGFFGRMFRLDRCTVKSEPDDN